jgi:hypothetical protein
MTAVRFYAALSDRVRFRAREYEKVDWLAAVPDGKVVYLVGKGIQPKERGVVKVLVAVALAQYGAQWRAVIPSEVEAQLDDLIEGRAAAAPPPSGGAPGRSLVEARATPLSPGISELLRVLKQSRGGALREYYNEFASPASTRPVEVRAQDTDPALHQQREHARDD